MNNFNQRCANIAERFLLTAVAIDDEAYIADSPRATDSLRTPDRHTQNTRNDTDDVHPHSIQSLDARTLVRSFAKCGLICSVMAFQPEDSLNEDILPAMKRADIVILDWQLHQDNGKSTLELLKEFLKDDKVGRLRLVAIYTGEDDIEAIQKGIKEGFREKGWEFELSVPGVELTYGHCRIVIYMKTGTPMTPDLADRAISEELIAKKLIDDFADMTKGLLPSIALTALAAVRENAHKVLDSFSAELDPAFLAHRTCLPFPDDAQQHLVDLLDSELHAIMDDATIQQNPANFEAIKDWLLAKLPRDKRMEFGPGKKNLSFDDTVSLLKDGLKKSNHLNDNDFKYLSSGFSRTNQDEEKLDKRLAWMFNFRTVNSFRPPVLQLGTVLQMQDEKNDTKKNDTNLFLCMRPKCDSQRLKEVATFLLLPFIEPNKKTIQLVLKTPDGYLRQGICMDPSQWLLADFEPNESGQRVIAVKGKDDRFFFTCKDDKDDKDETRFTWIGELKDGFAQYVAQYFASGLSGVAIDNSEWLRMYERKQGLISLSEKMTTPHT